MAQRSKISVLVGLFAFTAVLATAAVTIVSRMQSVPIDSNSFISMSIAAAPSAAPGGYLPLTTEPEFNDRYPQEKRDAKIHELPAQF